MSTLEDFGYTDDLENYRIINKFTNFDVGRVISEHKERYIVITDENEFDAEVIGNMRFTAKNRNEYPAVGDWVSISKYDKDKAVIYNILPRKNTIERKAVGKPSEKQIIASNIDYAFIVQSVDRDYSLNRIERYLTICYESNVSPVLIFTKIDLIKNPELDKFKEEIMLRFKNIPSVFISNESKIGIDILSQNIQKGKTYCLLGSSGVGKSTILNNLIGKQVMETKSINESIKRGKHVTTHRELFILENGGLLIDNPGMREVGITDSEKGLEITFDKIIELSANCKYKDCKHLNETGCAVINAVELGEIEKSAYENYIKLEKEKNFFEMNSIEKKKKEKLFGKKMKQYKKDVRINDL